ncbi:MAG: zinc-regulated TonB-dependent outer membrane receptor [Deltaproteobacteria bacterium]|nr:zinc-regulated TonB-dependent outer membrane receptor [Deltaproteobacteria bacterium]
MVRPLLVAGCLLLWAVPVRAQDAVFPPADVDAGIAEVDAGPPAAAEEVGLSPEEMKELEAAMKKDMQSGGQPGGPTSGSPYVLGSSEAPGRPSQAGPSVMTLPSTANMNPDISFIGDFAFALFSNDKPLPTGGHAPQKNGFNMQQMELAVGAAVDPYFRADGNVVIQQFGLEVEEFYATTTDLPYGLQARVGQFLTRFGRANTKHLHAWDFLDIPMYWAKVFGPEGNRGVATEISWLTPLPWYVELVFSANEAAGGSTARSFLGNNPQWAADPRLLQLNAALRSFVPLGDSLSLAGGLTAATGPHYTGRFQALSLNDFVPENGWLRRGVDETGTGEVGLPQFDGRDHRAELLGADLYLKWRPIGAALPSWRIPLPGNPAWAPAFEVTYQIVSFTAEWIYRRRQVPGGVLVDHGGYAQVFWRFASRGAVAARLDYGSGIPQSYHGGDPTDPEWTTWRARASTALSVWPSEFSRLRAQYSFDRPFYRSTPTHSILFAVEFAIGAHGAHAF